MKRVLILVEGQTEEAFVTSVLAPHLWTFDKAPEVTCLCTKRVQGRRAHRGGVGGYAQIKSDLQRLLRSSPDAVTTLLDYYGLPDDFPGLSSLPSGTCFDRVEHLERALDARIADPRFIANLVLHEFEGLLFSAPRVIGEVLADASGVEALLAVASRHGSPEEINDSAETHPSKRILDAYPAYRKATDGPQVALRIGLPLLRDRCPHFARWLTRLETL